MSDTYRLIIQLEKKISIKQIIGHLMKEGFSNVKFIENTDINSIQDSWCFFIRHDLYELQVVYSGQSRELIFFLDSYVITNNEIKKSFRTIVNYIKKEFHPKNMREVIGADYEPCPFVLDHE